MLVVHLKLKGSGSHRNQSGSIIKNQTDAQESTVFLPSAHLVLSGTNCL